MPELADFTSPEVIENESGRREEAVKKNLTGRLTTASNAIRLTLPIDRKKGDFGSETTVHDGKLWLLIEAKLFDK